MVVRSSRVAASFVASRGPWTVVALALVCVVLLSSANASVIPDGEVVKDVSAAVKEVESESSGLDSVVRKRKKPKFGGSGGDDEEDDDEDEDFFGDQDDDDDDDDFDDDDDDDGVDLAQCFPASALVRTADGSSIAMRDVEVGDNLRVAVDGTASEVFMFTHAVVAGEFSFVRMETKSGHSVSLTPGHFIYASGDLVRAGDVKVGDTLEVSGGGSSAVSRVSRIRDIGLFNPQTVHGDILVNDVRVSTYTTAVAPGIAHTLLAPLKYSWRTFGVSPIGSALEKGAPSLLLNLQKYLTCAVQESL